MAWAEASASMLLFNSDQVNIHFGHLMTDQLIGAEMLFLTKDYEATIRLLPIAESDSSAEGLGQV